MADYMKLAPFILRWEGGYANDPDDPGGATNMGVTLETYRAYCRRRGYPSPTVARLRAMTRETWADIFKTMFWDRWRADEIRDQAVAGMLVDWLWCSGNYGIRLPQKVLGVKTDGIVGGVTLSAVNAADPAALFAALKRERTDFIERICKSRPASRKFRRGWLNRIGALPRP